MFQLDLKAGTGPLCPQLYRRLEKVFGSVAIANEREPCRVIRARNSSGQPHTLFQQWGEAYCVRCPFCDDGKTHLWINHTYGQPDPEGPRLAARCMRRDCLHKGNRKQDLYHMIFGVGTFKLSAPLLITHVEAEDDVVRVVEPPGEVVSLLHLPETHPAVAYMCGKRKYSREKIEAYQIGYVVAAKPDYPAAQGRIYMPAFMDDQLVGWQCRFVGDNVFRMKYYTLPGMKKSRVLYNYDVAKHQKFVVVTEGPPKVHRLGRYAVAVFGNTISPFQRQLLMTVWAGKPIILMLDPNAAEGEQKAYEAMVGIHRGPLVSVRLPPPIAPDDYEYEVIWQIVCAAARQQHNVDLTTLY